MRVESQTNNNVKCVILTTAVEDRFVLSWSGTLRLEYRYLVVDTDAVLEKIGRDGVEQGVAFRTGVVCNSDVGRHCRGVLHPLKNLLVRNSPLANVPQKSVHVVDVSEDTPRTELILIWYQLVGVELPFDALRLPRS